MVSNMKQDLRHYIGKEKINYIHHQRLAHNWRTCKYSSHTLPLSEKYTVGKDSRTLVQISTIEEEQKKKWAITVFDLRHPGFHPVTVDHLLHINLGAEHDIFNLNLQAILVARSTAVLCFNGIGDDTPQELIAIDLSAGSDYKELWRDVIHDWGQFQLMRLFGREIYKFDLLNNHIEVHDIRTYDKLSVLKLVEEMRYPHGEIAGDGRHLAIPGKMSEDNSPAVCVWNVRRRTRQFLYPTSAFCPFRWFEKVAVSKGKVFGLLNRRCLFAWQAESGHALFKIDLTDSYPGQQNEATPVFTYLSVYNNYLATIHQDPACQTVYKVEVPEESAELSVVLPQLNVNWLKSTFEQAQHQVRICDVKMNEQSIILHVYNLLSQKFEAIILALNSLNDQQSLLNNAKCCIKLDSTGINIPGQLYLTPTKLLNCTPHKVEMYDFLL